jgi:hypothetical protein
VASPRSSAGRRLKEYLDARRPDRVGEAEWAAILREFAPATEGYLREVVRRSGVPFEQPWCGVRQRSFAELDQSLREIGAVYAQAVAENSRERARYCRRQVITAKDHARLAAHNRRTSPERRALKQEMVEWMLVWLGDPAMFPAWVDARKRIAPPAPG